MILSILAAVSSTLTLSKPRSSLSLLTKNSSLSSTDRVVVTCGVKFSLVSTSCNSSLSSMVSSGISHSSLSSGRGDFSSTPAGSTPVYTWSRVSVTICSAKDSKSSLSSKNSTFDLTAGFSSIIADISSAVTTLSPDSIAKATFSNVASVLLQSPSLCLTIRASIESSSNSDLPLVCLLR